MEKTDLFTIEKKQVYQLNKGDIILFNDKPCQVTYILKYIDHTTNAYVIFDDKEDEHQIINVYKSFYKIEYIYRLKK